MRIAIKDNKVIDFVAAMVSGIAVSYYAQSMITFLRPPWSTLDDVKALIIYVTALVAVALLIFQWNNRFRVKYGWALIAVIGAVLCALTDELMFSRNDPDGVWQGQSLFPIGVVLYSLITLPVMACVHYFGLVVKGRLTKA